MLLINIMWGSAPELNNIEWEGVWRNVGENLEKWAPLVSWRCTPKHLLYPESLDLRKHKLFGACLTPAEPCSVLLKRASPNLQRRLNQITTCVSCPCRRKKVAVKVILLRGKKQQRKRKERERRKNGEAVRKKHDKD